MDELSKQRSYYESGEEGVTESSGNERLYGEIWLGLGLCGEGLVHCQ